MTTPTPNNQDRLLSDDRPLAVFDSNYMTVHAWIRKKYGKANHCSLDENHEAKRYEWANIDGIYEKDIKHFVQLCRSCHAKMDVRKSTCKNKSQAMTGKPNLYLEKRVGKYTLDGEFVEEYRSVRHAARVIGCNNTNIIANIQGRSKHAMGYLWRYL